MKQQKRKFIELYVENNLATIKERIEQLTNRIDEVARIQSVRKYQELESEGPAEDGRAWLSIDAMVHSFYYSKTCNCHWGNQIWRKFEPILFPSSLIDSEYRVNYIQVLEPGWVISISYPDLRILRDEFLEIKQHIEHISQINERAYRQRIMLLNEQSVQKLIKFEGENPLFTTIASKSIKAMHLGLSRQGYNLLQRKIKERKLR